MRRVVPVIMIALAACGGAQIPQHSGYKNDKSQPWTKAKPLKFNDKMEAKAEGDLNYAKYQRAKWFEVALPSHGDLDISVDITPPGDGTNEDFDLALEILDPANRVISKSDMEDTDDAGNLQKKKNLKDLSAGKYLVHLYLQSRVDTAEFALKAVFHPNGGSSNEGYKSDFPAQVMFTPVLAQVPMKDDAPPDYKPAVAVKQPVKQPIKQPGHSPTPPKKEPDPPKVAAVSARVIAVAVVGGGTQITVARGTETGASVGMKVSGKGIGGTLAACNARTCTAVVSATPDQIKSAGSEVMLSPVMRWVCTVALAVLAGCPNNVSQYAHTGPDGQQKDAKELRLENNEAIDHGTVTYPGGNRADWKLLEIPEKQVGTLEVTLKWKVPRPGLQLAFDAFDQWGYELIKSKASARKKKGYSRTEMIDPAKGKIFLRVYAVGRGDAGNYTLTATFTPIDAGGPIGPIEGILDPPRLPAVPEIITPCDDDNFDVKKAECKNYCPRNRALAPKDWPPCAGGDKAKCETPDIENLSCWEDANKRPQCPTPWRAKFKKWCPAPTKCPDPPDPDIPACKAKGFTTRIVKKDISGDGIVVTVNGGKNKGVSDAWKVRLLRAGTSSTYPGGEGTIVRVDVDKLAIKFKLTADVLTANDQVAVDPP